MAKEIWYTVPEECGESFYCLKLTDDVDITRPFEQEELAEHCAEDFWCRHGYENSWPLDIHLYEKEGGRMLAAARVCMDMQPTFAARLKEQPL